MQIIKINLPEFHLKHKSGHEFVVKMTRKGSRVFLDPLHGWNDLSANCQQDSESLLDDIDDVIYNIMPEAYES
jgi:hypothetical protein